MTAIDIDKGDKALATLIRRAAGKRKPIILNSEDASAVLIGADEWRSIQETLYLISIPGMRASIREGMATPIGDCSEALDW